MSFGAVASAGDPLMRGLVGWYRMLGNANDSSGSGNTGTLVNSPTTASDKYNNASSAYTFAGASFQYMALTLNKGLPLYSHTAPYSICMWVRGAAQTNNYLYAEALSSAGVGSVLFGLSSFATRINVFIRTSSNVEILNRFSSTTAFDNAWHHVAFTDNAGTANVYIDGVKDATSFNYTASSIGTRDRCTIAAIVRASTLSYFSGSIFDVRLYNRELTAAEVGTLYRATQRI